ncbi:hypothetical protein SOVF_144430 isoform A [Spinacia oleracea]|uniref:Uncharacterized protein isoform X2 n=1 Tax=Spinacia oleracea TaxID=3562 RepID=A0ABM3QKA8_SPIOL|nr:uncharacterized protein LOC110794073 isoform X2 [Spinacia oleracea]KNA10432.1 hypothetical protein SOVF_144430 isoform A [Spinacia oleracea]
MGPAIGARTPFSWNQLISMTDHFSDHNLVGKTKNFEVFRGEIPQLEGKESEVEHVTVKVWNDILNVEEKHQRLKVERTLLAHPSVINCPNIVKLMGYCCEDEHVAAVYRLNSVSTLEDILDEDHFQWRDRILTALGLARLFEFFLCSEMRHLIHAVQPPAIILDQETTPVLYDFGLLNDEIVQLGEGADDVLTGCALSSCEDGTLSFAILLMRLIQRDYEIEDPKKKPIKVTQTPYSHRSTKAYRGQQYQRFYCQHDYFRINWLVSACLDSEKKLKMSEAVQKLESLLLFSLPVGKKCENVFVNGCKLVYFSYDDLCDLTDGFSRENLFAKVQLGEAYRGKIQQGWRGMEAQDVIVKMWGNFRRRYTTMDDVLDDICRLRDEVFLLTNQWMIDHKNTVKLLGYCFDEKIVGAVYLLKPIDTLKNLFDTDKLEWKDRIKVALEIARLLEFLHGKEPQCVVSNLSPAHIAIDQEWKPVLYDFSMIKGPVFPANRVVSNVKLSGVPRYTDPFYIITACVQVPHSDIYAFGLLLMSLICKCDMAQTIWELRSKDRDFKIKFPHAHESFLKHSSFDQNDGHKLSVLAVECLGQDCIKTRPKATAVVEKLLSLSVISGSHKSTTVDVEAKIIKPDVNNKKRSWRKMFSAFKRSSLAASDKKKMTGAKIEQDERRCVSWNEILMNFEMLEMLEIPYPKFESGVDQELSSLERCVVVRN